LIFKTYNSHTGWYLHSESHQMALMRLPALLKLGVRSVATLLIPAPPESKTHKKRATKIIPGPASAGATKLAVLQ
jgi:hypothetical protein